ncbi:serine/threonine-protein phosphatase 6 regulatory subunit 3 [Aricia agestis]|uniref:serine/threonine-protein phosphatase 6 regulatory subunit 3 n=1 Tax=Aricia agestis TaxID=91739 RepID=UPI001C207D7E|nr:serine/threonine-protein phosphatase 6 regulatory subunit 3 [Aricia agestis]
MFWRGNFIAVNDVNFLLKEENVTLSQVLEADDILPECRADNKALRTFLTKPEIRAELITLITEEPSKNLELTTQYRHAHIASEVLTSQLPTLRDQLAMDTVQMNRLCDFVNKPPPLNPLLASYFSKTIEMLFQRNPKQDWYAHHIVCLHVLDLFKSRRDFLPNLLRHISTSAITDVFKCLFSLKDNFDKIIIEWLDEHQVLDNLIHIICGTYEPEPLPLPAAHSAAPPAAPPAPSALDTNHNDSQHNGDADPGNQNTNDSGERTESEDVEAETSRETREARIREVASANAAALLCEVVLSNCIASGWGAVEGGGAGAALAGRLRAEAGVRALLQAAFTAPQHAARAALLHAATLLRALLVLPDDAGAGCGCGAEGGAEAACAVEHAVAPHVPLLHNALLRPPGAGAGAAPGVGAPRVAVAAVIARLAKSEAEDVFKVLLSLGTAGVLVDMVFEYPDNNFLHAQVLDFVRNALDNRVYGDRYAAHLVGECHILTRLMDAFEENEDKLFAKSSRRAGYMGHVVALLRALYAAGAVHATVVDASAVDASAVDASAVDASAERYAVGEEEALRWERFFVARLHPHLQRLDTPLGGVHPSDTQYEMEESPEMPCGTYDLGEGVVSVEAELAEEAAEGDLAVPTNHMQNEMDFMRLSDQRFDDMWGDTADADEDVVQQVLTDASPWEEAGGGGADDGGWARFTDAFSSDWPENVKEDPLTMELAQKMMDAFNSTFDYPSFGSAEPPASEPPTPEKAAPEPPTVKSSTDLSASANSTTGPPAPEPPSVRLATEPAPAPPASQSPVPETPTSVPASKPPAAEPSSSEPPAPEPSAPEPPAPEPSEPEPPAADDAER